MQQSDNNIIAKNTVFLYVRMAIALVVSLYTSRVVINVLGVVDYGINNVVAGFVSMFAFLNSSLTASIQRFYNFENGRNGKEGVQKVYQVAIIVQILLAILVLILVETLGLWYLDNKLVIPIDRLDSAKILFHTTVLSMVILIIQVPYSAVIMSYEKMDYYALVGVIDTFLRLGIVIILPYIPYDKLITYGFLGLSISILNYLMYYLYSKKHFPYLHFNIRFEKSIFKDIISFSGWNTLGAFSIMLRNQGLNMIINLFFGPVVNAARGIAYSIQSAMMGFIQNICTSTRPQITESYAKGNTQRSFSLMFGISKINFILLYLMALPVIGEIDYILNLWLDGTVPEYTSQFALLVLSIALVDVLNTPISIIMLATGKISVFNTTASIIGLLSLPLSYLWLYLGGSPNTVFYVSLFISVSVQIACVIIMCKTTSTSRWAYCKAVIIPLAVLVLVTFWIVTIPQLLFEESFIRFVFTTVLSTTLILFVSYCFVLSKAEKNFCRELVTKIFKKIK